MIIFYITLFFLIGLQKSSAKDVCYDGYGCFTNSPPFGGTVKRPFLDLPASPEKINTTFILYTRELRGGERIRYDSLGTTFNATRNTKLICHGWLDNGTLPWIIDMKNAFLDSEDLNVIGVDWGKGAAMGYPQATANTQMVGAEAARLIQSLIINRGAKAGNFHLIGHSLGAHTFGYTGQRVRGIGRITGLDPAGPFFVECPAQVRLDKANALFVDIIHSNAKPLIPLGGLGTRDSIGHVDFFPNGGRDQPQCGINNQCSHLASHIYFADSIRNTCRYTAFPCASYDDFTSGKCTQCSSRGCNRMGYWASALNDTGDLYLSTQSPSLKVNMCKHHLQANLYSNNLKSQKQALGIFKLTVSLRGQEKPIETVLDDNSITFKPNTKETVMLSIDENLVLENIENIAVYYERTWVWKNVNYFSYDMEWSFSALEIVSSDDNKSVKFCPTKETNIIRSQKSPVKFEKCN